MTAYELDLPTIKLFNAESGIGLDLVIDQDPSEGTFDVRISFPDEYFPALEGYNRFWAEVVAEENEFIFGGGDQYTYLNLKGRNYPIWVREQGVGRNKSSEVTQVLVAIINVVFF